MKQSKLENIKGEIDGMDDGQSHEQAFSMRSIQRILDVLLQLSEGHQTLTEVARAVDLNKATVGRLLTGLGYRSFVVRDQGTGKYSLGPGAVLFLEKATNSGTTDHALVRRHLEHLSETTGETVSLYMLVGTDRVCILEVESREKIKYKTGVGTAEGAYAGAAGKVLLASLPQSEREALVASLQLVRITDTTITDRGELLESLEEIRAQGYAISDGERVPQCTALAVPVRNVLGVPVLSLCALGPSFRLTPERTHSFLPALQHAARLMEQNLPPPATGETGRSTD